MHEKGREPKQKMIDLEENTRQLTTLEQKVTNLGESL